jgi:hypothetical protein
MFGNLAKTLMEIPQDIYDKLIANHKKYVVEFVINALKPDNNSGTH